MLRKILENVFQRQQKEENKQKEGDDKRSQTTDVRAEMLDGSERESQ